MQILGIENVSNEKYVLNEIAKYLFKTGSNNCNNREKSTLYFSIELDYEYYYPDFLKYGIDLNADCVSWWKFNKVLNSILLDENSNMHKIVSYRTYEKPSKNIKAQQDKEHKQKMRLKQLYTLKKEDNCQDGMTKLWNYVEKKVGEKKE